MRSFSFLDGPRPIAFAHRGGADGSGSTENTMSAFASAVALGYRYVETDVHATSDGVLVAFHDPTLDRIAGRDETIEKMTWRELQSVVLGVDERVPRLVDLLDAWPDLRVNIDIKAWSAVDPLIESLRRANAVDRVCVGSFSDLRTDRVRAAFGGRICSSLGPRGVLRLLAATYLPGRARRRVPTVPCAQVPLHAGGITLADRRVIDRAHAYGMQVHVWTVDDPAEMNRLLNLGVDGIMSDSTRTLRDVLVERGEWEG